MPLERVLFANTQNPQASSMMIQIYNDSVAIMFGRMGEDEMFELKNKSMSWLTGDHALADLRKHLGYRLEVMA